ncbi:chemotaxis protein CheW [Candidatus Wolfebacteria bacterium]|nr:chemotaxis protein CheW [Candidatus Wolfebacteria bacterium]
MNASNKMPSDIKQIVSEVAFQSQSSKKKQEEFCQIVIFELDKEEYAALITDIQEIIKIPEITPIPNAPLFISGILNLRGKIVVVIDLEKRFSLAREQKIKPEHIIIVETGDNIFGIIVDKVSEVLKVPLSTIQPAPSLVSSKIKADYLKGVVAIGGTTGEIAVKAVGIKNNQETRILILLDLKKMLEEKELLQFGETIQKALE